jgi:Zn-dependent protease
VLDLLLHILRVFSVVAVCALALVVHEEGHLLCARKTGRLTGGWGFRWYSIGVRIEVGDLRSFWRVALAGPTASLALAALLAPWLATGIALPRFAFWVNAGMVLFNLLPVGPSDGAWIVKSLRARRASSASARAGAAACARRGAASGRAPARAGDHPRARPRPLAMAARLALVGSRPSARPT